MNGHCWHQDGLGHMVVWSGEFEGGMLHDPNPKRLGLKDGPEFFMSLRPIEKREPVATLLFALAAEQERR